MEMDFNIILQEAQELLITGGAVQESKKINRTLKEIVQEAQELQIRNKPLCSNDAQTKSWLYSKGIDFPKLSQKLEALNVKSLDPIACIDADNIIAYEKEVTVLSLVDEVNSKIKQKNDTDEWSKEKRLFLNSLGGPSQKYVHLQRRREIIQIDKISECCKKYTIESYFANNITEYNKHKDKDETLFDLLKKFVNTSERIKEFSSSKRFWSVLVHMISGWKITSTIDPIQRRQQMQKGFIGLAKRYLENKYRMYMSSVMDDNLEIAERGGDPNPINFIEAYIRVYFRANKMIDLVDVIDGNPLWPHVYFAMRCGEMEVIMEFYRKFGSQYKEFFQVIEYKIKCPEEIVKFEIMQKLLYQYLNTVKWSTDPFQKALFCIILGHNAEEYLPIEEPTEDDILWTQLSIVRQQKEDRYKGKIIELTYMEIQSLIFEKYCKKENSIKDSETEFLYYQLLMLTGQFEAGIDLVARIKGKHSHAVHMAIALNELHVLCTPRDVHTPLLSTDESNSQPFKCLNLVRLILKYVRCLDSVNKLLLDLNYYRFLSKFNYNDGRNVYMTCVCDMIMKTKYYKNFRGKLNPSGEGRMKDDILDKCEDKEFSTNMIIDMVAEELVVRNKLESAMYLFDLTGSHEKAITILISLMPKCIHKSQESDTMRQRLDTTIEVYNNRLEAKAMKVKPETAKTFQMLRKLLTFFQLYNMKKNNSALGLLARFNFIPMKVQQLECYIENFKNLPKELAKLAPDILLATMRILCRKYRKIKRKYSERKQAEPLLCQIRQKAFLLQYMAGSIPCSIPVKIKKRLVDMENFMNTC